MEDKPIEVFTSREQLEEHLREYKKRIRLFNGF